MEGSESSSEIFIPYRKHSSGDLQSRLKTRKILGVGETDNGDIHRSKISQVLGHNDHLYVKFPRCYTLWHLMMASLFTGSGLLNIIVPGMKSDVSISVSEGEILDERSGLASRLYGSVLLGFAVLLWMLWRSVDKGIARILMAAIGTSELLQLGAVCSHSLDNHMWDPDDKLFATLHLFAALGSCYFFWAIGSSTAGLRKTPSYKDLRETCHDEQGLENYETHALQPSSGDPEAKKNE